MKTIIYFLLIIELLAGCSASNSARGIRRDASGEAVQFKELVNKADSLDIKRANKFMDGNLDAVTDSVIKVYIQRLKDSVNSRLLYFQAVSTQKTVTNKDEAVAYLNKVKQAYSKELNNIIFLDDLFKASTFNRLNTAAFFGPGEYQLTDSATEQAARVMQQIVKGAFDFSVKYKDRKLRAMFIVLGYADEQEIGEGSELYKDLVTGMSTKTPDRKQLNTELSNRRASAIKSVLRNKYRSVFPSTENYLFSSSFIATGKGEMLPPGNFKDLQPIDERRRVVLLYWSILPDLN